MFDFSVFVVNVLLLSVLKVEVESSCSVVEVIIVCVGFLFGVIVSGVVCGGEIDFGLNVGVLNGLGLGIGVVM